jgi:hypothetical protein
MKLSEIIIAVFIHLLTPLVGLGCYIWLCRRMKKENVPSPPLLSYFILFFTFGGWLIVALTLLLWKYSGMFLVGSFYLVFIAPVVTAALAIGLRDQRALSIYHRRAYRICMVYSISLAVALATWFSIHWAYQLK